MSPLNWIHIFFKIIYYGSERKDKDLIESLSKFDNKNFVKYQNPLFFFSKTQLC